MKGLLLWRGSRGRGRACKRDFRRQTAHLSIANVVLYGLCEAICQYKCDCPRKISKCTQGAGKPKALLSVPLTNLEQMINAILHKLVVILPKKPQREKPRCVKPEWTQPKWQPH